MDAASGMNKLKLLYFLLLVAALMTAEVGVLAARTLSPLTATPSATDEAPGGGISRPPATTRTKRRELIGSTAPTCTYNECRGCRHRCSVQGVPVDAGDPMNSAYHYRCICHI